MVFTDPWSKQNLNQTTASASIEIKLEQPLDFEDNFECNQKPPFEKLPDSSEYLENLERKLKKLQSKSNLVADLSAKKESCLIQLLASGDKPITDSDLELEEPIDQQFGRDFVRHLFPQQAQTVGELVPIINFDHLEVEENKELTNRQSSKTTGN